MMDFHSYEWHSLGGDWWYITVPDGYRGVNVFLIIDQEVTLIDAGHYSAASATFLDQALQAKGIASEDIARVIYTHPHIDHMGGGSWLQTSWPRAQHLAHAGAVEIGENYGKWIVDKCQAMPSVFARLYPEMAPGLTDPALIEWTKTYWSVPREPLSITGLAEGQEIHLGRNRLVVLYTPGHQSEHIALYCPERSLVITGDLIVGSGTNIEVFTGGSLGEYYRSLEKLRHIKAEHICPGHGGPRRLPEAIEAAEISMSQQSEMVLKSLQVSRPMTLSEVVRSIFPILTCDPAIFFNLEMILAHLLYLIETGKVASLERDDMRVYLRK